MVDVQGPQGIITEIQEEEEVTVSGSLAKSDSKVKKMSAEEKRVE